MIKSTTWFDVSALMKIYIYGIFVGIFCWYCFLLPIVLTGNWRNKLVPSASMFLEFFHVYIVLAIWAFTGVKRVVWIGMPLAAIVYFGIGIWSGGNPGHAFLIRYGWGAYLYSWGMLFIPAFVSPALAGFLLLRADRIAPKIIKNWRPIDG